MKALILGAGGQVGRALVSTAPQNASVTGLGRSECDLADPVQICRAVEAARPDVIFNTGAYTAVDKAESEPEAARLINAEAPAVIARAALKTGARMVHISTDFVFDGDAGRPRRPEEAAMPLSVYGRTKYKGERAVAEANAGSLIVRTAWVYAAQGANFVNTMLNLMRTRERINVVADQIGSPTRAASLAQALWSLAAQGASGVHHYTDSGIASWYDFAVAIGEEAVATGLIPAEVRIVPIPTSEYPTPARRPHYSVLDKTATWALLGGPAPHWRTNLRANLRELKSNS